MISIIIPTLNASRHIRVLLESLKGQTRVPDEIIVIDSSSDDDTLEIASTYHVKTFKIPRNIFDHGGTRNYAMNISSGDIVIFMTQDVTPYNKSLIENLIQPLDDPLTAASFGRQVPRDDAKPTEKFSRLFNYLDTSQVKSTDSLKKIGIRTFFFSNVCSAIKKKEFREVGGFPEKAILNEDMILAAKLIMKGYKVAYEPSAMVYHSHNPSLLKQFKRYFEIGISLSRERWITELVTAEGQGYEYLKEEIRFLLKEKQTRWIPYACIEAALRYTGFRLGLAEDKLPIALKKRMSTHKYFWDQKKAIRL
jgi:rhamnosyltransferase